MRPKGRVIAIDVKQPERANWKTIVVPEQPETLGSAQYVGGKLILSYLKDAHAASKIYTLEGAFVRDVSLPGIGAVGWFAGAFDETRSCFTPTPVSPRRRLCTATT